MNQEVIYPIGTPGQKWGDAEKQEWLALQSIKRSYQDEVINKIEALRERFEIVQYGALSYDEERYPLFAIKSRNWDSAKKTVLITGGVHGYETSGVQGAIRFADTEAEKYAEHFNIVVTPCISPWGYETINRWNPNAVDPNRSFYEDTPSEESGSVMAFVNSLETEVFVHIDLHETTDTDKTEFRPALSAREGTVNTNCHIPDGFYTVGNTPNPQPGFQKAIIDSVATVTHIAPADENGQIIGAPVEQEGVVNYDCKKLFLCAGLSNGEYVTTTEVYPDSPKASPENCILAQIAAVKGGLDFVLKNA